VRKKIYTLLFIILFLTGSGLYMANSKDSDYLSRTPRTLRVELAAPYDLIVNESGLKIFVKTDFKSTDSVNILSMTPWDESSKSTVIVSYGFPEPVFELPPSTFVTVNFDTAHVARMVIIPMLEPLNREDTILLARSLLEVLNAAALKKVPEDNLTLEEVWLRMQLAEKDMDQSSFQIGQWQRDEAHGKADFVLNIEIESDESVTDPAKQRYSMEFLIDNFSGDLDDKLKELRLAARKKIKLYDEGEPCTENTYECDIPDLRVYLDTLRKEKLIPLRL